MKVIILVLLITFSFCYDCDSSESFVISSEQEGSVGCDSYDYDGITMSWLIQVDSDQRVYFFLETQETEDEQDYIRVYDGLFYQRFL